MVLPDEAIPETPIKIDGWSSTTGIGDCETLRTSLGSSSLSAGSSLGRECAEDPAASTG